MMKKIVFYGTRGSNSLTAKKYMEFGGATTCILLNLADKHIMVDCGSGVSNALEDLQDVEELHLFISHSHIDHIDGIPSLLSAFGEKKLHVWGKSYNGVSIREAIDGIMNRSLWPVRTATYQNVEFHEIEDELTLGDVTVSTMDSNHPGGCTLFRFACGEDVIVTAFDFCHLDGYAEKLCAFADGCTTLIYDGNMTESELLAKQNWGHSTPEAGARIGAAIGCREVLITHFGAYDDDTLSAWETSLRGQYPNVTFARSGQGKDELKKMVDIGSLLSMEKDNDELLTKIVEASMDITGADGGTLYLLEDTQLEFKVLINRSKKAKFVRKYAPLRLPSVRIDGKNACATAAREKKLINVKDCYAKTGYDFSGVVTYDKYNDYHTQSVIVIPLLDESDDVIGVLQLINATNASGQVVPFPQEDEEMLRAIASQASMALANAAYSQQINDFLYGFVKVMSVGIDERTPYNSNHTRNMVRFANRFFDYEETVKGKFAVDAKKRREILMSIWLHDIGKILTPVSIINKDSRLGDLAVALENRFERRKLLLKLSLAKGEVSKWEYTRMEEQRTAQLDFIHRLNTGGFLSDELQVQLDALNEKTYREEDGSLCPVLTPEEYHSLSIVKGTLTPEERSIMEAHVSMTQKFLSQLHFPKNYSNIPVYAGNHHEFLDGTGYPNHLTEKDLPWPCRLITVCDIFEALIAKDRPYKAPLPIDKAFTILYGMADEGKLDVSIVRTFEQSSAWLE